MRPLLVRLHLGGAGEEIALDALALGQGDGGDLLHQLVPLGLGEQEKAAVKTFAHIELVAQVLTELGGHGDTALQIHIMLILAGQHKRLSLSSFRWRGARGGFAGGRVAPQRHPMGFGGTFHHLFPTAWNFAPLSPT